MVAALWFWQDPPWKLPQLTEVQAFWHWNQFHFFPIRQRMSKSWQRERIPHIEPDNHPGWFLPIVEGYNRRRRKHVRIDQTNVATAKSMRRLLR